MKNGTDRKNFQRPGEPNRRTRTIKIGIGVISFIMLWVLIFYQVSKGEGIDNESLTTFIEFITNMIE